MVMTFLSPEGEFFGHLEQLRVNGKTISFFVERTGRYVKLFGAEKLLSSKARFTKNAIVYGRCVYTELGTMKMEALEVKAVFDSELRLFAPNQA